MELQQLKTFRTAALELSFTRTAAKLGYAQSSVTAQIQALEREIGAPLFDRLGRRMALTDAGKRLLPYALDILSLESEARIAISNEGEVSGSLTISAAETHCAYHLPELLSGFDAQHPRVELELLPSRMGALDVDLKRSLKEGAVDLGFVFEEPSTDAARLEVETLAGEPASFVVCPDHPLASLSSVAPADLVTHTILLTEEGCAYRRLFDRALREAGVSPARVLQFSSVEAIKRCTEAGMGVALLSSTSVSEEVSLGKLSELDWTGSDCGALTQMVWNPARWLSPALEAFLDTTREYFSVAREPAR
ncbi:LysR family transcriptional regulator [soil metagenome]|jgi:DNA-binding transcriptional LysR family regulator